MLRTPDVCTFLFDACAWVKPSASLSNRSVVGLAEIYYLQAQASYKYPLEVP